MSDLLTDEAVEILSLYRDQGALAEFLEDFVEDDDLDPYVFPDHQRAGFNLMWEYSFLWLLWSRRAGKTFSIGNGILGFACLLSGISIPVKVGLFSGSFGQVKIDFTELQKTWGRSPFIQSITEKPPRIMTGHCEMKMKGFGSTEGVTVEARPLNPQKGSQTSKGFGYQILVVDEFQLLPRSTYSAILPTASASGNPMKRVLERQKRQLGLLKSVERFVPEKNRLIFASTAAYQFLPAFEAFSMMDTRSHANRLGKEIAADIKTLLL